MRGWEQRVIKIFEKLKTLLGAASLPEHLRRGELGERAAKKYLQQQGLKFLTANFDSRRGELDLVLRDGDCLVFAEVKTRSSEDWTRPSRAVNPGKKRRLSRCAMDYLRKLSHPPVKIRFDIVEVLLSDGEVNEIRHLPNTFTLSPPYRYG
ncbi:MAG TPA: YraN family protein [Desulfuromonadaceae bacterium]|nr:YraN family protein [Desulfuromonadaceae bacterium]